MDIIAYEISGICNENHSQFFFSGKYFYTPWKCLIVEYTIFKKQKDIMRITA